jgi:filamentous hemagglutinin family protein
MWSTKSICNCLHGVKEFNMRHLLCGTVLGGLIVVQGGLASAQQIVPNGLGTQVTVNGQQFDITGGTRAGANLFHSFAKFGLSQAQIAHFLSNPAIRNILARVTGGEASVINGLIKVTGGNSNLYLMNPAGIVFGQGASLNVPAAFHATTANAIKIGNGYFGMNTTAAELALLTAEPNGYAFSSLNQNLNPGTPAGVILNQADLSVNPGQTIVLAGNQVINTGTIQSPNGTVVITATADGKFVNVSQSGSILSLDLPVAVNQDIALQNLRPVLPSDIPQLLTGTAYVSGTISTASTVKNPDSLINITGERVILDKANLDNLGTDGLIQIRVAPGITSEGYVFLDRVRNYEQLVNALAPGSTAYLINKTDSGVEKVNQVVAKNGAVQRIDIVGDGNTGQIWFGRDFITVDTLPQYETQIAQWGQGLTGSREIYLYACNLAASVAGKELVGEIGNLTNSTVLASTDITGSSQYGGNWQFEYSTGNVAGQLVFDAQAVQSADVKLQTFTVLNNSDTGSGSLRQAISDANAASGADSIAFAPATNGTPIVLTSGELTVSDSAGLTINGNGQTNTIIDGNNTSRVFNVTAGDITFDGVTIRNGNTPGDGGGILANGNVTLNNSTMSNNQATGGYGGGGFLLMAMSPSPTPPCRIIRLRVNLVMAGDFG